MSAKLAQTIGILQATTKGDMNPVRSSRVASATFTGAEDSLTIAQKLNSIVNLESYGTLNGMVVATEEKDNGLMDKFLGLFSQTDPTVSLSTAYVFIDVLHASYANILNPSNYKNYLTEVQIFDGTKLPIGAMIQLGFKTTDYSQGAFIKLLAGVPNPAAPMNSTEVRSSPLCGKPKVSPKTGSPSSVPFNFSQSNVGYVQALYTLAKWQSNNTGLKISKIEYPFSATEFPEIGEIMSKTEQLNQSILNNTKYKANPNTQWVQVTSNLFSTIVYTPNEDSKMVVTVEGGPPIDVTLSTLADFSRTYVVEKIDQSNFYFSFPTSQGLATDAAVALTKKNLGNFLNSVESAFTGPIENSSQNALVPTIDPTTGCIKVKGLQLDLLGPDKAQARIERAKSALGLRVYWVSGQGGYHGTDLIPTRTGKCDCAGFVSWVLGLSRNQTKTPFGGNKWISTTDIWRDATKTQELFQQIPLPVPGCIVTNPDNKKNGKVSQGHVALVTQVTIENGKIAKLMAIDCGSSRGGKTEGKAIRERSVKFFLKRENHIFAMPIKREIT